MSKNRFEIGDLVRYKRFPRYYLGLVLDEAFTHSLSSAEAHGARVDYHQVLIYGLQSPADLSWYDADSWELIAKLDER